MFYACNGAVQHLSMFLVSFYLLFWVGLVKIPASVHSKIHSKELSGFFIFQGYVKVYAPLVTSNTTLTARGYRTY